MRNHWGSSVQFDCVLLLFGVFRVTHFIILSRQACVTKND